MKRLLLAVLVIAALPLAGYAQSAVPLLITYQGRVTDAAGNALGSPTPVNRTVTLRIWGHATDAAAGSRLYSESQTVTIANGEFSVLVGTGTAVSGEAKPALDTVFTADVRFLGVTVDDGNAGTVDPEISPRQQIVTTPYAFRSKVAESVLNTAITTAMIANNAVTGIQIADSAVGTAKIADATIVAADLANGSVTSAKILDGTIATADIANGQVTAAKLGSDVGTWTTTAGNVYRTSGNVGIGTTVPTAPFSLGGTLGNTKLAVWDNGSGTAFMGFGIQGSQFRIHTNQSTDRFSFLNAPNGTETMSLLGNGNLGLGIVNPQAQLSLGSGTANTKLALWDDGAGGVYGMGIQASQFRFHTAGTGGRFSFLNSPGGTEVFTISSGGTVGVGITNPQAPLQVHTGATDSRALFTNATTGSANADGFAVGIQNEGAFVWNHETTPLRLATSGAERIRIEGDGRMGFNITNGDGNQAYIFKSYSSAYIMTLLDRNNTWSFSFMEDGTAWKKANVSWSQLSDRNLKKDISNLTGSLDRLLQLRSVTFDFKDDANGKGRQTGFIAQEVREVFPEWVKTGPGGFLGVGMSGFEAQTVQALRELRAEKDTQIAKLEARVKELEGVNLTAAQRLDSLEKRFNAMARPLASTDASR